MITKALWISRQIVAIATTVVSLALSLQVSAKDYEITAYSQLIGRPESIVAKHEDTIYSLALQHRLGVAAFANANTDVDPFLLGEGVALRLPTHHIIPNVRRRGIVINLPEMRLYYFSPTDNRVYVYPVGIGQQGWDTPLLESTISSVVKDPSWTPPASIRREYKEAGLSLPKVIPAGVDNPLGEYALRIGDSSYLIHGTNNPKGVGLRVSHGCIRLYAEDIAALASMIEVDAPVAIINQPIKLGQRGGRWYVQAHMPVRGEAYDQSAALEEFIGYVEGELSEGEVVGVKRVILEAIASGEFYSGVPILVSF